MCLFKNTTDKVKEDHNCSCEKCSCNEDKSKNDLQIKNDLCEDVKCNDCETDIELNDLCLCGGCCKS